MENFMNDDYRIALKKFESMLQTNKVYFFDSEEFEEIVYHYMDGGKMNLAKKAIELGLSQHPTSIPLKLIKAELLILDGKFKLAEKLLLRIEYVNAKVDEIYILKASILSKSNNHEKAIEQLFIAIKYTNDFADIHALLGMEYLFLEKFHQAIEQFEECLKIEVEDYSALFNILYCYEMLDDNESAISFLNAYIDENPYSEIAWHQIGRQYFILKKYTEALRAFDYAILIDERFIGAYVEKGRTLEALERYEEAIANYLLTLDLDDPTSFTYIQIAGCFEQLDNKKMAIKHYHYAIEEDPMIEQTWLGLTNLYLETNNYQKALHYIHKAIKINGENVDFLNRLAEINIKLNLFEEAAETFKKSIELGDNRLVIYLALGDVLHFIGEFEEAKNVYLDAFNLFPNDAEIHYRLAGIFFVLHKNNEALSSLKKALSLDFSYKNIAQDIFPEMFSRKDVIQLIANFNL